MLTERDALAADTLDVSSEEIHVSVQKLAPDVLARRMKPPALFAVDVKDVPAVCQVTPSTEYCTIGEGVVMVYPIKGRRG
jgi:hypothetical protein